MKNIDQEIIELLDDIEKGSSFGVAHQIGYIRGLMSQSDMEYEGFKLINDLLHDWYVWRLNHV